MNNKQKGFSDKEKNKLKEELMAECEKSWALRGYKKTSISHLTSEVNISTGAFYLLFDSKEDLFCDILEAIQTRMKVQITEILSNKPNKEGFVESLKWLFRSYDEMVFLYDFSNPDFQSFISKIPPHRINKLKLDSISFSDYIINQTKLEFRVEKEMVYSVINSIIFMVSMKDNLFVEKEKVFDFVLDGLLDKLLL